MSSTERGGNNGKDPVIKLIVENRNHFCHLTCRHTIVEVSKSEGDFEVSRELI